MRRGAMPAQPHASRRARAAKPARGLFHHRDTEGPEKLSLRGAHESALRATRGQLRPKIHGQGHERLHGETRLRQNSGLGAPCFPSPSLVTVYSITSSAPARRVGGTARPSARAVFRLTMSSNRVGCSTGRFAGLAPLSIVSTKPAMRRHDSSRFGP